MQQDKDMKRIVHTLNSSKHHGHIRSVTGNNRSPGHLVQLDRVVYLPFFTYLHPRYLRSPSLQCLHVRRPATRLQTSRPPDLQTSMSLRPQRASQGCRALSLPPLIPRVTGAPLTLAGTVRGLTAKVGGVLAIVSRGLRKGLTR